MRTRTKLSATATTLSLALLVTACSGVDDGGDEDTGATSDADDSAETISGDVTMWIYPVIADEAAHRQFWDGTIAAFNAEYPDVDVTVEINPWQDRDQALATAIAGNSAPDVVYLIPDQLPAYADNIEPMDRYLSEESKADFLPNTIESVSIDGQMMGAPILASAVPLVCNKTVFDAVGVTEYPATWDDVRELAPQFAAEGYSMIAYNGDVGVTLNLTFYPLLWQAGGDVFTEDGSDVAFNGPEGVNALEFLDEMVDEGFVADDTLTTNPSIEQTELAQGQVACEWFTEPQHLVDFWGEENVVVLPPLTEVEQVAYGTVGSLSMLSSAADKQAAGAWIDFATGAEQAAVYSKEAGFFPVKQSTDSLHADNPVLGEAEKYTNLTTVGPLHPSAREVMGILAPEIQAVLIGQKEPQQALDDAAAAAQALLQ